MEEAWAWGRVFTWPEGGEARGCVGRDSERRALGTRVQNRGTLALSHFWSLWVER